ncbi:MAG: sugar ABC transporter permease [Firmicutes bacterium]|nr:sugar ABC transporter permease [Bacillota bacterium]
MRLRALFEGRWGYFFIAPAYIFFALFTLYPLLDGLRLSLFDAGLAHQTWVGLENYARLLTDEAFRQAVGNTLHFVVIVVPLTVIISLGLSLLIFPLNSVWQSIFRGAFYLPTVASGVVLAMVWLWIYNPTYGLLNYLLGLIGVSSRAWLGEVRWALPALSVVVISWSLGRPIILFLAGLAGIPQEINEAASIDGAGSWQRLVQITLPLLRPTTMFVLVTQTIGAFQTFIVVQLLTRGGPAYSTQTVVYSIYETAFQFFEFGYSATMGIALLLISGAVAFMQFKLMQSDIQY